MLPPSRPFLFPLHPPMMAPTLQLATSGPFIGRSTRKKKKLSTTRRDNCVQGTETGTSIQDLFRPILSVRDDIPPFVINKVYILVLERNYWTKFNFSGEGVDWKSSLVISLSPPGIKWRIKRERN